MTYSTTINNAVDNICVNAFSKTFIIATIQTLENQNDDPGYNNEKLLIFQLNQYISFPTGPYKFDGEPIIYLFFFTTDFQVLDKCK